MYLTRNEELILDGEQGEAKQLAMRLLVAIGDVYEAPRMINIQSAQISGVSYKTIGEPGLNFLTEFSSEKPRAAVKSMVNPAGMDLTRWRELQIPEEFARKQLLIMGCFEKMKIQPTCTCIPYHENTGSLEKSHISWAESSAVVFANSVIGAYTNREGGPTALASAILGLSPLYGMHLEHNRRSTHEIKVRSTLKSELDYSVLGYWVGKNTDSGVPTIQKILPTATHDQLKALCASMAASGSVAMFRSSDDIPDTITERMVVEKQELSQVMHLLSCERDFGQVALGCPHLSLAELRLVANLVSHRRLRKRLWCFTSRHLHDLAQREGLVRIIEQAGGKVICDTCIVVSPMTDEGVDGVVTNSCKAAHYLRSLSRIDTRLMDLKDCVRYALQ